MHNFDWSKLGSNRRQRLAIPEKENNKSISLLLYQMGGDGRRTFATFDYSRGGIREFRVGHNVNYSSDQGCNR